MTDRSDTEPSGRASGGRNYEGVSKDVKRGTWTARYRYAPGPKGTRTRRGFATQRDAKKWRDEQVGKVSRGNAVDPREASQTVGAVYALWMTYYRGDPRTAESTIEGKQSHWRVSLAPTFDALPLAHVNKAVILKWQVGRLNAGRAPSTINNEHGTLRIILDFAIDMGALDRNYAREVKPVTKGGLTRKAEPNAEVMARLIEAIEPRYLIMLRLALFAGLRSGEARGLRRQDITRNEDGTCSIRVAEQLNRRGGRSVPKGRKSRTVIEAGFVADLIDSHIAFYGTGPEGEIVTHANGRALNYNTWRDVWRRTVKASGVDLPKGQGVHLLRHGYASFAIEDGKSPAEVAANLGHAQVSTTFAYYVHATQRRPVGATAALAAVEEAQARIEASAPIACIPRARHDEGEA